MKKVCYFLILLMFTGISGVLAETFVAEVEGINLEVLNINLKKQFSDPIGASSPNKVINLADGVSAEDIGVIAISDPDQFAYELSFDFANVAIPLKAWASDGAGNYYYTTAGGVQETTNADKAAWSGYDYMDTPKLAPERTDGRVVVQSYFPEAVFIAAGESFTVSSLADLDYTALLWDGTGDRFGPFQYQTAEFPAGQLSFGLVPPDVVLAFNEELTVERYAFGLSSESVTTGTFMDHQVVSIFFTADGHIYDGAGKYNTGYNSTLPTLARVQGVSSNGDGTYNLAFARFYSESAGEYIFDVPSDNSFTRRDVGAPAVSMVITDPTFVTPTELTVWYKRVN